MSTARLAKVALLSFVASALADETISVADYLERANSQGLRIIHSSDLVPGHLKVTFDPDIPITHESVRKVLDAYDLQLQSQPGNLWLVVRRESAAQLLAKVEVELPVLRPPMEEVVVSTSLYRMYQRQAASLSTFDHTQLITRPAIGNDAMRVVNQLPGSSSNGVSARPRVRGGEADETLILFDGVRLYEPFHFNKFSELYSGFDPRIVESIDFYAGGFPVELGDRLSAAMVIGSPDITGDLREAGVGLYNISWLQTSAGDNQGWMLALRRSNLELVTRVAEEDRGVPTFADAYARYEWQLDSGDRVSANVLWLGDDMEINNSSSTEIARSLYSSTYGWLSWERDWTDAVYSRTWFGTALLKDNRDGRVENPGQVEGSLEDSRKFQVYNIKQAWDYAWSRDWLMQFGWDYRYVTGEYAFRSELLVDPVFSELSNFARPANQMLFVESSGHQLGAYGNVRTAVADNWTIELGLRFDGQHYERQFHSSQWNPRFNVLYRPLASLEIRFGWGEFSQSDGVHELMIGDGAARFQPTQLSSHSIIGIRQLFENGMEVRLELYRKRGEETGVYFENLTNPLSLLPELQPDRFRIAPESYSAEGIELSLNGGSDAFSWWGNYSYSLVRDVLPEGEIKRSWDQTRTVNLGLATLFHRWRLSLSGTWHNGWRTTPLTFNGTHVVAGERNSLRLGSFSSVDAKVTREWGLMRLEAGLTNVLSAENVVGVDYRFESGALVRDERAGLPVAPFLDFYWRF